MLLLSQWFNFKCHSAALEYCNIADLVKKQASVKLLGNRSSCCIADVGSLFRGPEMLESGMVPHVVRPQIQCKLQQSAVAAFPMQKRLI